MRTEITLLQQKLWPTCKELRFKYLNVCIRHTKVQIGDEELPSSFHASSSSAAPGSGIETAEAIVKHVVLPLIWELFRLQQMRENAPADFRIPLPLSVTESTRLGVGASRGAPLPIGSGCSGPSLGSPFPQCSLPTPSLQASESAQTEGHNTNLQGDRHEQIKFHLILKHKLTAPHAHYFS